MCWVELLLREHIRRETAHLTLVVHRGAHHVVGELVAHPQVGVLRVGHLDYLCDGAAVAGGDAVAGRGHELKLESLRI